MLSLSLSFSLSTSLSTSLSLSLSLSLSPPPPHLSLTPSPLLGSFFFSLFRKQNKPIENKKKVLALLTMEQPVSLAADDVRDEKVKLLRCVAPPRLEDVVLGQYTASGSEPEGYTDDPGVPADSKTPTFASVALFIDNERWAGVPFIIKAGKALNERVVVVRFQFKSPPRPLLANASEVASALAAEVRTQEGRTSSGLAAAAAAKPQQQGALPPAAADRLRNELVLRLQPDEAIYMKLVVKKPGLDPTPVISELDLDYNRRYTVRTSFLGGGRFLGFSSERATEREKTRERKRRRSGCGKEKNAHSLFFLSLPPFSSKLPKKQTQPPTQREPTSPTPTSVSCSTPSEATSSTSCAATSCAPPGRCSTLCWRRPTPGSFPCTSTPRVRAGRRRPTSSRRGTGT